MLMLPDDEERQIATQRRITGLNALDTTEAVFSDHVSEEDKPCASASGWIVSSRMLFCCMQ